MHGELHLTDQRITEKCLEMLSQIVSISNWNQLQSSHNNLQKGFQTAGVGEGDRRWEPGKIGGREGK